MTCDVFFFAEDPGAANYMSGLPATLAAQIRIQQKAFQGLLRFVFRTFF